MKIALNVFFSSRSEFVRCFFGNRILGHKHTFRSKRCNPAHILVPYAYVPNERSWVATDMIRVSKDGCPETTRDTLEQLFPTETHYWAKTYVTIFIRAAH